MRFNRRGGSRAAQAANSIACKPAINVDALLFSFVPHIIYPERHLKAPITELIWAIILIPMVVAVWRLTFTNFAELVRQGSHSYMIRTRNGIVSKIPFEEIRDIKNLGAIHFVKSRTAGWFLVLAGKKDPISAKLIETKPLRLSKS